MRSSTTSSRTIRTRGARWRWRPPPASSSSSARCRRRTTSTCRRWCVAPSARSATPTAASASTGRRAARMTAIKEQSPDIAMGVDHALEAREGIEPDELGAGDQGMMFGYASDETAELMPMPILLAHRVARRLAEVRKDGTLPVPAPRRQEPGDGRVRRRRQAAAGRHRARQHPARPRRRPRPTCADGGARAGRATRRSRRPARRRHAPSRQPDRALRDRRADGRLRAVRAARSSSTPTAAWPATAAAASAARTRPRSTAPAPTWRATSPRTSSPPAWRGGASCSWPTPSAWPSRSRSTSQTFGTGAVAGRAPGDAGRASLRPAPGGHHPRPRPAPPDLPPDRGLRALRAHRPRPAVGADRPRRRAAQRRGRG